MIRSFALGIVLACAISATTAQFTCTLTNRDEDACLEAIGEDNDHCVWCNLAGFGFCLGERQAEKMEQNLPNIQCDRYSGGDDDETPSNDDAAPDTDDNVTPSDDSLPDDFWTCLQKSDSKSCIAAKCTWCESNKFGFGLCMTGPTAESAADSDFFTCSTTPDLTQIVHTSNVLDTNCVTAFLQDPTQEGCTSSTDAQGNACEWCSIAGMTNICFTKDQADITSPLGVSCLPGEKQTFMTSLLRAVVLPRQQERDPLDTACLLAFLQDPTEGGCDSAMDSDGNPCEFCTLQGRYPLCLNTEQAMYGQQIGMDCASSGQNNANQEESTPMDEDDFKEAVTNPYDPSCAIAFFTNPKQESCIGAVDQGGQACKYCTLQGTLNLCLTPEQAKAGASLGIDCGDGQTASEMNFLDSSCLMAFAKAGGEISPQECTAATDNDGSACEFCFISGITDSLCVTTAQAAVATQFLPHSFMQCGPEAAAVVQDVDLPPNFLECLEEYQEGDCNAASAGCSWCTSEVGIGFCLAEAAARALAECNFFSCDRVAAATTTTTTTQKKHDTASFFKDNFPLDPICLAAGMGSDDAETVCNNTIDSQGTDHCVWCNAAGVYGLCMSSGGASMAQDYLECDMRIAAAE